tara:strand:+ start:4325 stop:4588 length:264 start_codon:yes stop_codon:yes gene_type:complete
MIWNNWAYTKRKQKEMTKKSADYQQHDDGIKGLTPLYRPYYSKPSVWSPEYKKEMERQHRIKIISIAVITLECIIGIAVIAYFASST